MTYVFSVTNLDGSKATLIGQKLPMPRYCYLSVRKTEVHTVEIIVDGQSTEERTLNGKVANIVAKLVKEFKPSRVIESPYTGAYNLRCPHMDVIVVID